MKKPKHISFGPVEILAGKHKGRRGYYDDDTDRYALVYLEYPCLGPYVLVRTSSIKKVKKFVCLDLHSIAQTFIR